ncbi:O-antigen ligase family protein [Erysipelothrix sp. HDW6A]|uniref:O-antigen ligase family protein n=1 Tax=Erysipelothrix sp. HDW6A TaxID=2714928 RepID=UPI001408EE7A|nr:O-antigen ligase family protein [Erysipelothrix sp. HDW6A]QIK57124.1 O-antigen ligase family protein [Erysipelothrix sp. HDW6A]
MNDTLTILGRIKYNFQENVLFLLILMLFLPNYLMYPMMIVMGVFILYELIRYRDINVITISVFILYTSLVAASVKNWLGLGVSLAIIYVIAYVAAIKRRTSPRNYMKMQYYIVWSSLLNFLFNFIHYEPKWFSQVMNQVMALFNVSHLPAWKLPEYGVGYFRAYSTFDNPNFYAFILMIVILVCFNQIQFQLTFKNYRLLSFYLGAFVINGYALFLTGTRSIWAGVVIGLFLILFVQRKWTQLKLSIFLGAIAGIFVLNHPALFPRFMQIADHTSIRTSMWDIALQAVKLEPWFGKGLMTYAFLFDNTHAHNLYIEILLSLGIVGALIIVGFMSQLLWTIYKHAHYLDYPLALSLLVAFLIYGIFDFPLYYPQTILLFSAIFCLPKRD